MSQEWKEASIDFCNALEAACINFRRRLGDTTGQHQTHSWDPGQIKWQQAAGEKGPYEFSEDVNSLQFKAMLQDLAEPTGVLSRDGWFYWTFKSGAEDGR